MTKPKKSLKVNPEGTGPVAAAAICGPHKKFITFNELILRVLGPTAGFVQYLSGPSG